MRFYQNGVFLLVWFVLQTATAQSLTLSTKLLKPFPHETIRMDYNRAYPGIMMDYQVIKVCDLLRHYPVDPGHFVEFIAKDNFSVFIPAKYLLACDSKKDSVAYLAIEPKTGWPMLKNHTHSTAGPYALLWTDPARNVISDEYWAWSVVRIQYHEKLDESMVIAEPSMIPKAQEKQVLNGYKIYVSHCAACHTIDHKGKASIGPDLKYPKTAFEYYPDIRVLKQFIRDPKSIKNRPPGRMSGSSYAGLSDKDLDDLIVYFQFVLK